MTFGLFLGSLINIFSAGIFYEKKTSILVYIYFFWGIINILMNLVLVKYFNIYGVVITSIITYSGISVTSFLISAKYFTFRLGLSRYLRLLFGFIFVVAFDYILNNIILRDFQLLPQFCIFLIFIIFINIFILNSKEKRALRTIFNTIIQK